mgnify:CR=1 FL=1
MEHAQALLGDLDRHRHKVVRAEDVECAKRSGGVRHLVEVAHAAPGTLAVGAAWSETARDESLAVAAVVRVAAGRVLRIEPQREESGASPPHRQARRSTAGMGGLSGGESCSTAVWAGSVEVRAAGVRGAKRLNRVGVKVLGGGPVSSSPRKGNRERVGHASLIDLHSSRHSSEADGEPLAASATADK